MNSEKGLDGVKVVELLLIYLSLAIETDFVSQLGADMNFISNSFSSWLAQIIKSILSPENIIVRINCNQMNW